MLKGFYVVRFVYFLFQKLFKRNVVIDNEELINSYENISVEYIKISIEIIKRKINKEFSVDENEKINEIINKTGAIIFDSIPIEKLNKINVKEEVRYGVEKIIDTCMDKNR